MPEEPKAATGPTVSTTPIYVVPIALTPVGLGNFITLIAPSIKTFVIASISFFRLLLMD